MRSHVVTNGFALGRTGIAEKKLKEENMTGVFPLNSGNVGMITKSKAIIPIDAIATRILLIRGQRVILDADLAQLYGVITKQFNRAVKEDFMFQLTKEEDEVLRFQSGAG